MNATIKTAETDVYLTLLQLAEKYPVANAWLAQLPNWLATIKDKSRYAHAPFYQSLIERLPVVGNAQVALDQPCITAAFDWQDSEYKQTKINFWDSVYGFDMSCIKKIALTEPLVDTVEAQQIATRVCSFKSIDMSTCTKDDLAFSVPYRFAATRNDFIHAFVVYWDCGFTRGHKEIWFSTSPRSRTTHWRQTVFYLQEHLACTNGEVRVPCCPRSLCEIVGDVVRRSSKAI